MLSKLLSTQGLATAAFLLAAASAREVAAQSSNCPTMRKINVGV